VFATIFTYDANNQAIFYTATLFFGGTTPAATPSGPVISL
jgi:hypothetical protein